MELYRSAMVLGGVGDALGYKNTRWENCPSGVVILSELKALGGLEGITLSVDDWPVSDDTVMHIVTAQALVSGKNSTSTTLCLLSGPRKQIEFSAQYPRVTQYV